MTVFILQFKHSIKSYHLNCLYQFPLPFLLHYKRKAEIVFCKQSYHAYIVFCVFQWGNLIWPLSAPFFLIFVFYYRVLLLKTTLESTALPTVKCVLVKHSSWEDSDCSFGPAMDLYETMY